MDRPEVFEWNFAIEMDTITNAGRATVLGLSMISEQLDKLIELIQTKQSVEANLFSGVELSGD